MPPRVPIAWSPVIGSLFAPNGMTSEVSNPESVRSEYDRTILAHMMQSPWDHEFHVAAPVTLAASAVKQQVVSFSPGSVRCGIVRGVAMGVAVLADFDNIRWAIEVDGTSQPGFDNIIGPFGVFIYPKPVLMPLNPDQVCRIVATNLTALAIPLVTGYLMGTHFPVDIFQRNGQGG
jgi:hypothetical protein